MYILILVQLILRSSKEICGLVNETLLLKQELVYSLKKQDIIYIYRYYDQLYKF
jgi:hypothetical protein